jgi:hypothetical protein
VTTHKPPVKLRKKPPYHCKVDTAGPYELYKACDAVLTEQDGLVCTKHKAHRPFWP